MTAFSATTGKIKLVTNQSTQLEKGRVQEIAFQNQQNDNISMRSSSSRHNELAAKL
jgi:hypothetical protein